MNNIKNQTNRNGGLLRPALLCLLTLAIAAAALIVGGMSMSKSRAETVVTEDYNGTDYIFTLDIDAGIIGLSHTYDGQYLMIVTFDALPEGDNSFQISPETRDTIVIPTDKAEILRSKTGTFAWNVTLYDSVGTPLGGTANLRYTYSKPEISGVSFNGKDLQYTANLATVNAGAWTFYARGGVYATVEEACGGLQIPVTLNSSGVTAISADSHNHLFPSAGTYSCVIGKDIGGKFYASNVFSYSFKPLPVAPEKEGYNFVGWFYDAAYTRPYEGAPILADTTLYAKYEIKTFTITLQGNAGYYEDYGNEKTVTVEWGKPFVANSYDIPIRLGYEFDGWFYDYGAPYTNAPVYENFSLSPHWRQVMQTLTFDTAGGDAIQPMQVGKYTTIGDANLPTPTREGYTFTGWIVDGNPIADSVKIMEDISFVATWEQKAYTVTVDPAGGSIVDSSGEAVTEVVVAHGVAVVGVLNGYTLSREGYDFLGWYVGETKYDINDPITSNCTIVARWQIKTYTVTFIIDGEVFKTLEVQHGTILQDVMTPDPALAYMNLLNESGQKISKSAEVTSAVTVPIGEMTTEEKIAAFIGNNWWVLWALGGIALASIAAAVIASVVAHKRR